MGANFGIAGLDWQNRVNWDRLRSYRTERARAMMKKHGIKSALPKVLDPQANFAGGVEEEIDSENRKMPLTLYGISTYSYAMPENLT